MTSNLEQPLLSVNMITYGHEKYIKQAIEGVLMQVTDFSYELIIAEDCSPDNTAAVIAEILRSHPNGNRIKYFRHNPNIGAHANVIFAAQQSKGKYIAFCEGDDYWIDPHKLQKQVDFLAQNPAFGLVHTNNKIFIEKTQLFQDQYRVVNSDEDLFDYLIFKNNPICTLTVCLRTSLYFEFISSLNLEKESHLISDYPIWIWFSIHSKIKLINDVTGVYRILTESASQSTDPKKHLLFIERQKTQALFFLDGRRTVEYELAFYSKYSSSYARHGDKEKKMHITQLFLANGAYLSYVRFKLLKYFSPSSPFVKAIDKLQYLTETKACPP